MKHTERQGRNAAALDELIEEIAVDASGEDEGLWAFRQAFEDGVPVPCDAFVVGEPVSVCERMASSPRGHDNGR